MVVSLRSNLASLQSQRHLNRATGSLAQIYERLSSGQRINSAKDDAAGLAISASLNVDRRLLNQSVRNLNDGISYLNIADAALEEADSILIRIEELSIQAANGTYGYEQRAALDLEAQALKNEFERIISSVEFNDTKVFTDDDGVVLATGTSSSDVLDVSFREETETYIDLGTNTPQDFTVTAFGTGVVHRAVTADVNGDGIDDAISFRTSYSAGTGGNTHYLNVSSFYGNESGTYTAGTQANTTLGTYAATVGSLYVGIDDAESDGDLDFHYYFTSGTGSTFGTIRNSGGTFTPVGGGGLGAAAVTYGDASATATGDYNNDGIDDTANGFSTTFRIRTQDSVLEIARETIEIEDFSLTSASQALAALGVVGDTRDTLQTFRGRIGASSSRIAVNIELNKVSAENFAAAESQIVDADVAEESAQLVRASILQQATSGVLAQANQQPQLAIFLLNNTS